MKKLLFISLLFLNDSIFAAETIPEPFRTFTGHENSVLSVAFSPDGRYALSGSCDNTLKLWNISTEKVIRNFKGHTNCVTSVAFSPDGQRALSGSYDKTLKLWEVNTGSLVRSFSGHTHYVMSVAFSPDGQWALSGSDDKTLKLWDVNTGSLVRTFTGHEYSVGSVAFSPDGQTVLSGSADTTLKLWNVNTGGLVRSFSGHTSVVTSVAFSPDGQRALSGSSDNTLKLWDVNTGSLVRTFTGHTWYVWSVAFSPDGLWALSGSWDKTLKLWDVNTGSLVRTFTGHTNEVRSVAFSPDGQWALSGSIDNTLKLWDLGIDKTPPRIVLHQPDSPISVACSPFASSPRPLDTVLSAYRTQAQTLKNQQDALLSAQQQLIDLQGQVKAADIDLNYQKNHVADTKAKLQKAQEMELIRPGFSADEERSTYHQAQENYRHSEKQLNQLKQAVADAEKQVSQIQTAIQHLQETLTHLCGEVAAARFHVLKNQLEKTREVTTRGEAACSENMTIRECKTQAESTAKRKASEQGTAILIESANFTDIFGENDKQVRVKIRDKITQQFSSLLLNHEIVDEGFTSNGVYFYEIRATVQGQVPEKLKAEFLK